MILQKELLWPAFHLQTCLMAIGAALSAQFTPGAFPKRPLQLPAQPGPACLTLPSRDSLLPSSLRFGSSA